MNIKYLIIAGLLCFVPLGAFSQSVSNVDPAVVKALESMSEAQRQALIKRFMSESVASTDVDQLLSERGAVPQAKDLSLEPASRPLESKVESAVTIDSDVVDVESPPPRFGDHLFDRDISTFAPTTNVPVPDSYLLGVGDQLVVRLFGAQSATYLEEISRDGAITIPGIGELYLAGLSIDAGRAIIRDRIERELIGVEASVTLGQMRAITVFMAGEVATAGAFAVSALTTVTQALYQAGGLSDIGSYRSIRVIRNGQTKVEFDLYDLLMFGETGKDIRLQSGDVVFVPPYRSLVEVRGSVNRPMRYELVGGETLEDVIKMAAGFSRTAYRKALTVESTSSDQALPRVRSINLDSDGAWSQQIQNGDIITVQKQGEAKVGSVALKGAVYRPGVYGWFQGMRLSDLVSDVREDLYPEADVDYGLIQSLDRDTLNISIRKFSLRRAMGSKGSDFDLLLAENDTVLIFTMPSFEDDSEFSRRALIQPIIQRLQAQASDQNPVQTISISGGVKSPGTYPLIVGATVRDLIESAGGLKDSAFRGAAELRRLIANASENLAVSSQELNLIRADSRDWDRSLQSRDHLTVRNIPNWSPSTKVTIEGEVAFPGEYLVQSGETLASVIDRAGGLTEDAFADGAIFIRQEVAEQEAARLREFSAKIRRNFASRLLTQEQTKSSIGDVASIVDQLDQVQGLGRVLIDLPSALAGDPAADITVVDEDRIIIPPKTQVVTVVGEVREQGAHSFEAGLSLNDYIALSAGITDRADNESIYIIRPNGSVSMVSDSWWRFTGTASRVGPGDTIVIPINVQYQEPLLAWRDVTQILYQGIVTIAALGSL